jgi:hypothetical protein
VGASTKRQWMGRYRDAQGLVNYDGYVDYRTGEPRPDCPAPSLTCARLIVEHLPWLILFGIDNADVSGLQGDHLHHYDTSPYGQCVVAQRSTSACAGQESWITVPN